VSASDVHQASMDVSAKTSVMHESVEKKKEIGLVLCFVVFISI